jgi:hypothetical protein
VIKIIVPNVILCNEIGYEFLSKLAGDTIVLSNTQIDLDFRQCNWFDGNLCAVLGNILDGLIQRNNRLSFFNLNQRILETFTRNKFLGSFTNYPESDLDSLTIPYQKFKLEDEQKAKDFIKQQLFDKPDMPKMTFEAKKAILVSIFEVCINAITHGECEFVYCCGQFFPHKKLPEVSISFVDLGRTIRANVNDYLGFESSGNQTILWALDEGNTTKTGLEPGGLGLKILQNLINYNKGSLQIVSADGFVELKNKIFVEHSMKDYFPGTIVTIKLLLGDSNIYFLSNEDVDMDNIF